MMGHFLMDVFAKSVVLLLGAWGLNLMMRRTSAAARHLVWVVAFAGVVCLPVLALVLPEWRVPVLPSISSAPSTGVPRESIAAEPFQGPAEAEPDGGIPAVNQAKEKDPAAGDVSAPISTARILDGPRDSVAPGISSRWWSHGLLLIWIAGVCVSLGFTFAGVFRLRRLAARARRVNGGRIIEVLNIVCREIRFAPRVVILGSDEAMIPVTWGIRRPHILLPAAANEWPVERLRAVLLHEMAHVRRWDVATQLAAQLARAVYWLNPVAWIGIRRLRIERERACDDFVLRCGLGASEYAESLVHIVQQLRPAPALSAAAVTMARVSGIEGRVQGILSEKVRRGGVRAEVAVLFVLLAAIAGSFLSAIRLSDGTPAKSGRTGIAGERILEGREGIEKMAAGAAALTAKAREEARGTDDAWTITLPDGEFVRLVAIGRPMDNPRIWWDPDGYPIEPNPRWGQETPTEEIALVIDSSQHAGTAFRGWAEGTPGLPVHGAFSGSGVGTVLKIGKGSWQRAKEEGRDLALTLGYDVGEWKEISRIVPEEKVEIDGATYSLNEVEIRPAPWAAPGAPGRGPTYVHVDMRYTFDPDVAVGVGVVDQDGEITSLHTQMIYINRSGGGDEARYTGGRYIEGMDVDHLVLLNRPRKWSTLRGFALEPKIDELTESTSEGTQEAVVPITD